MTDIIDRLRADTLRSGTWADTGNLMLEAADEIERLRAAIAADTLCVMLESAEEEVARAKGYTGDPDCRSHIEQASVFIASAAAAIRNRGDVTPIPDPSPGPGPSTTAYDESGFAHER